jgi:ParB/RepB/Spo0J family partition protein
MLKKDRTIKIKLGEIGINPFRDYSIYPLSEEKIEALIKSIKENGFWTNISGRQKENGRVEISFGHHRLAALKRIYGDDHEIVMIISDLSDSEMIKRMSSENDEAYNCPLAAIDDAVKSARDYLNGHKEIARKFLASDMPKAQRLKIGAPIISKFIHKNLNTVQKSIERLNLIESGEINKEALYKFPSSLSSEIFARIIKEHKIKIEDQNHIAEKIVKDGRFGERSIYEAITEYYPRINIKEIKPHDADYCEIRLIKITELLRKATARLEEFIHGYNTPVFFGGPITKDDVSSKIVDAYNRSLNELSEKLGEVGKLLDIKNGDSIKKPEISNII